VFESSYKGQKLGIMVSLSYLRSLKATIEGKQKRYSFIGWAGFESSYRGQKLLTKF